MTKVTSPSIDFGRPWEEPWPKEGLETIGRCPVCGAQDKSILYSDLVDNTFFCAPGVWTLWQCHKCRSAYLDPRPTPEAIGLAYKNYYTHGAGDSKTDYHRLGIVRKVRRRLVNGYTRARYCSPDEPQSGLGYLLAHVIPFVKQKADRYYRHLPKPKVGSNKLLDIGCGDGGFLLLAKACGWDTYGWDPDENAVLSARAKGLHVINTGEEYFDGEKEVFDVITLGHVIEHVHDPRKTLQKCFDLLKPGGMLWIETPNVDSIGGNEFGCNWRGWETPRHLTIFSRHSLRKALRCSGFRRVIDAGRPSPAAWTFKKSLAMTLGYSPSEAMQLDYKTRFKVCRARLIGVFLPSRREFLTLIAYK